MEQVEYKGYTIEIIPDEMAHNPRKEFDHLGTMICSHRSYDLGDMNTKSFDMEKLERDIEKGKVISLNLYLYDHSGITMNTTGFTCQWDSGQVGIIIVDKKKVREEYSWKRITKARIEQIEEYLRNEVQEYDNYLTGAVYGYRVLKGDDEIGSCWGYSGMDHEKSGLLDSARNEIDYHKERTEKEEGIQQKLELV